VGAGGSGRASVCPSLDLGAQASGRLGLREWRAGGRVSDSEPPTWKWPKLRLRSADTAAVASRKKARGMQAAWTPPTTV
jgi:hypothetical protein